MCIRDRCDVMRSRVFLNMRLLNFVQHNTPVFHHRLGQLRGMSVVKGGTTVHYRHTSSSCSDASALQKLVCCSRTSFLHGDYWGGA